jgi:thioredoxin 1
MSRVLTDAGFEKEVLKSPGLKVVDFWAEWCGPCKALGPTIESIAEEFKDTVGVFKLDVDANPQSASQFNVRSIPTVLFFKDGALVDQLIGTQPKDVFTKTIKKHQGA